MWRGRAWRSREGKEEAEAPGGGSSWNDVCRKTSSATASSRDSLPRPFPASARFSPLPIHLCGAILTDRDLRRGNTLLTSNQAAIRRANYRAHLVASKASVEVAPLPHVSLSQPPTPNTGQEEEYLRAIGRFGANKRIMYQAEEDSKFRNKWTSQGRPGSRALAPIAPKLTCPSQCAGNVVHTPGPLRPYPVPLSTDE